MNFQRYLVPLAAVVLTAWAWQSWGWLGVAMVVTGGVMWTLLHLKYKRHIRAEDGKNGEGGRRTGRSGHEIIVEVPLGTVAKDAETGKTLFEITQHEETRVMYEGGLGGLGNDHFKTPTNQAPRYAQPGLAGIEATCILELKVLADVGLVGFPNAGKSTLLSSISAARPEIGDYPFTTLTPNLGIVSYHDNRSFVMADIPGIIEGAHLGKGLGTRFLRHIERNSALLFLIAGDSPDIKKEYDVLLNELKQYNPELLQKERILGISKADLLDEELMKLLKKSLPKNLDIIFISAVTGFNLDKLKDAIWNKLN